MTIDLFVYGTLQRGFAAHARYCRGVHSVVRAWTRGRLFEHPHGYPVLFVSPHDVHALGSRNPFGDVLSLASRVPRSATAALAKMPRQRQLVTLRPMVEGELLMIAAEPFGFFTRLDAYEGYAPGAASCFVRALLDVKVAGRSGPSRAWAYVAGARMPSRGLVAVEDGRWPSR